MKKIVLIAAVILGLSFPFTLNAQTPPHPGGGSAPGSGNTVVGGTSAGAPIGSGTFILLALGLAYASRKVYTMRKPVEE